MFYNIQTKTGYWNQTETEVTKIFQQKKLLILDFICVWLLRYFAYSSRENINLGYTYIFKFQKKRNNKIIGYFIFTLIKSYNKLLHI